MDDLIQALQIFRKYSDTSYPTHCEHDELFIMVNPHKVSEEDINELIKLGFHADYDGGDFYSYRFGSA